MKDSPVRQPPPSPLGDAYIESIAAALDAKRRKGRTLAVIVTPEAFDAIMDALWYRTQEDILENIRLGCGENCGGRVHIQDSVVAVRTGVTDTWVVVDLRTGKPV